jgi:hypothetical protein
MVDIKTSKVNKRSAIVQVRPGKILGKCLVENSVRFNDGL